MRQAPHLGIRCVELGDILETTHVRPLVDLGEDVYAQVIEDRACVLGMHVPMQFEFSFQNLPGVLKL